MVMTVVMIISRRWTLTGMAGNVCGVVMMLKVVKTGGDDVDGDSRGGSDCVW